MTMKVWSEDNIMEEFIAQVKELIDNGAGYVEVWEFIEDNSSYDPADIFKRILDESELI